MNEFGSLIEPPPVPFRFGAPGWYVLGLLVLIVLAAATWLLLRHYQRNAYRRAALRWLQNRQAQQQGTTAQLIYDTNMLLKRIAIRQYGRAASAAKEGDQWIDLLNKTAGKHLFNQEDTTLLRSIYHQQPGVTDAQAAGFAERAGSWIQRHHYRYAF